MEIWIEFICTVRCFKANSHYTERNVLCHIDKYVRVRATVHAVSHRPLTAEAGVQSYANYSGINGGKSGTGKGFSPSTSVLLCLYHFIGTPYSSVHLPLTLEMQRLSRYKPIRHKGEDVQLYIYSTPALEAGEWSAPHIDRFTPAKEDRYLL
jgi:hypothetical protein